MPVEEIKGFLPVLALNNIQNAMTCLRLDCSLHGLVEGFGGIHEDDEINSDVIVNGGIKSHASDDSWSALS